MNEISRSYIGAICMVEVPANEHFMEWYIETCTSCHEVGTLNFWDEDKKVHGYFQSKKAAKKYAEENGIEITQCDSGKLHGCKW